MATMTNLSERIKMRDRDLTPAEMAHHSERLIKSFRDALTRTPEFILKAEGIVLDKESTEADISFVRGRNIFTLKGNVVSEEFDALALMVESVDTGNQEIVHLVFEKQENKSPAPGGLIRHKTRHKELQVSDLSPSQNVYAAIEEAEALLRKLNRRTFLPSVLSAVSRVFSTKN